MVVVVVVGGWLMFYLLAFLPHPAVREHLHAGHTSVTVWTNDLTADYVHENSAYST
jgi:hypothetical protein